MNHGPFTQFLSGALAVQSGKTAVDSARNRTSVPFPWSGGDVPHRPQPSTAINMAGPMPIP